MGDTSATGVCFTRNPSTGEKMFFGEWLPNAQGEDVVAGIRTPRPDRQEPAPARASRSRRGCPMPTHSSSTSRRSSRTTTATCRTSSSPSRTASSICLQTRNGKRSGRAEVKIAVDLFGEGLIDEDTALLRVAPDPVERAAVPDGRSQGAAEARGQGVAGFAGCGHRPGGVQCRRRGSPRRKGTESDPGPRSRPHPRICTA